VVEILPAACTARWFGAVQFCLDKELLEYSANPHGITPGVITGFIKCNTEYAFPPHSPVG